MNRLGGYHHLPYNSPEIVAIIESEAEPELELFQKYFVNSSNFNYGWLSPECVSYSCLYMGHIRLANDICRKLYNKDSSLNDDFLLDMGWIKVYSTEWYGDWNKINNKQIKFLEEKNIKNFTDELEQYI